jgi:DNA polymerase-3 subunit delta
MREPAIIRALKLTLESLRTHLAGEPARAYLVTGDEALLVGEAADAIRARAKRAGFDEREVFFIERVADWEGVRASSNNLSLFGSRKLIEIRLPSAAGYGGAMPSSSCSPSQSRQRYPHAHRQAGARAERSAGKAFEPPVACVWPVELARLPQWLRARRHARVISTTMWHASSSSAPRATVAAHRNSRSCSSLRGKRDRRRAGLDWRQRASTFQLGEAALGADVPRAPRIPGPARRGNPLALWSIAREIRNVWGTPTVRARLAALGRARNAKRRAAKLPYARSRRESRADRMIKGQHRGDTWDEMALLIVEFAGRRSLPLVGPFTGSRAA